VKPAFLGVAAGLGTALVIAAVYAAFSFSTVGGVLALLCVVVLGLSRWTRASDFD
jgi:hypothetical protein